jgi:hypothetical protein
LATFCDEFDTQGGDVQEKPDARWEFYQSPNGRPIVREEINDVLGVNPIRGGRW